MKKKKILFFDTETTGLDPVKNDIIQLSGCIDIGGKTVEKFDIKMQPFSYDISEKALEVHGMKLEEIKTFQCAEKGYDEFINKLTFHINKFDPKDKAYPAGYNVGFDIDFLGQFFIKNGDKYLGSWLNWRKLDPLQMFFLADFNGVLDLPNYKLETLCDHYGIEIKAHDAMSDIMATRELVYKCLKTIHHIH